jgi:signal transduction histidine kinase
MLSIRTRIALACALVAVAVAATIGFVVIELTARDGLAQARDDATAEALQAARYYQQVGVRPAPAVGADDTAVPASLRRAVAGGSVATYVDRAVHPAVVWAGTPVPGQAGPVFVARSYASGEQTLDRLRRTLLWVGAVSALGGALLGLALAWPLTSRLRTAAATAQRVAEGDLEARVGVTGRDEVASLATAVDRMAAATQEQVDRERRFVADVAHDLRTPITGLVTAAELLPAEEAVAAVRRGVEELRRLVEDLLEVARLEAGVETADLRPTDLGRLVARLVDDAPDVRLQIDPGAPALTEPRRVERIVANLLANARTHGAPPIEIDIRGATVRIRDHGPGFPPAILARAAERFAVGDPSRSTGTGLGLAIAAGQAHVLGGRLELANVPDGGALVTLTLREVPQ